MLVLVLCLIFLFPFTLIALIVGLFFGLRYAFRGPELDKGPLNSAMDKAADMAESIKQDVQNRKDGARLTEVGHIAGAVRPAAPKPQGRPSGLTTAAQ